MSGYLPRKRRLVALLRRPIRRGLRRVRGETDLARLVRLGLEVGPRTFIGDRVYIDPGRPWLISIGEDAVISPFVSIFAHDASMRIHAGYTRLARVVIGSRVYVGAGAIILPGTVVGDDSIIGAGAVVKGAVPSGSVVVGNPGRVITDVTEMAARHRAAAEAGPSWPYEGWSLTSGITGERRREQREMLTRAPAGYIAGRGGSDPR